MVFFSFHPGYSAIEISIFYVLDVEQLNFGFKYFIRFNMRSVYSIRHSLYGMVGCMAFYKIDLTLNACWTKENAAYWIACLCPWVNTVDKSNGSNGRIGFSVHRLARAPIWSLSISISPKLWTWTFTAKCIICAASFFSYRVARVCRVDCALVCRIGRYNSVHIGSDVQLRIVAHAMLTAVYRPTIDFRCVSLRQCRLCAVQ